MNSVIGTYDNFEKASGAIAELKEAGYPAGSLSLMGRVLTGKADSDGLHVIQSVAGRLTDGAFAHFSETAIYRIPELGYLFAAGGIVATIAKLNRSEEYAGLNRVLAYVGVFNDMIPSYCEGVENGRFLVVAHGNTTDITVASEILEKHITYSEAAGNHTRKFDFSLWIKNLNTDFPLGG